MSVKAIFIFCATILASNFANSQTTDIASQGTWTAYKGLSENGKPLCGMFVKGGERSMHIKYFLGNVGVTVQLFKTSWKIPNGTKIPVSIGVDGDMRWNANAIGRQNIVERTIGENILAEFEAAFRSGVVLNIEFLTGNETPWRASLNGSNLITTTFVRCMRILINESAPTQPFDRNNSPNRTSPALPTQPFTNPNRETPPKPQPTPIPQQST